MKSPCLNHIFIVGDKNCLPKRLYIIPAAQFDAKIVKLSFFKRFCKDFSYFEINLFVLK